MKIDIIKICAGLVIVLALLMTSGVSTETTWRHSGFELWGYDINFTDHNASNIYNVEADNIDIDMSWTTIASNPEPDMDSLWVRYIYSNSSGVPSAYRGSAIHARSYFTGSGQVHGINSHMIVTDSSNILSEQTPFFTDLSSFTYTCGSRLWGTDQNIHGPDVTQADLLSGSTIFINNYNSTTITNGSVGSAIVSYPARGGGEAVSLRGLSQTYPIDIGLAIVGKSGTYNLGTTTNGFDTGIQIGGKASGWMTGSDSSKIGTGISITDDVDTGIAIKTTKAIDIMDTTTGATFIRQTSEGTGNGAVSGWRNPLNGNNVLFGLYSIGDVRFQDSKVVILSTGEITDTYYAGTGNDYACFDSAGKLYRSNTAC